MLGQTGAMDAATRLVGRQAELSRLSQIFTEPTGHAVLVSGQAGVGKTALIAPVCVQAVAEGSRVVHILGVQAEESFALGGLHQLLTGLHDVLADLDDRDRAALAPVSGAQADSSVSPMHLMVAVLNLLTTAAKARPVLLVIDDVQWLDDVSAVVLSAVGRRLADRRIRILAARRVPGQPTFATAGWTELVLDPLDAADSEQLLARATVPLTPRAKTAILTQSAGNPLALVELPRAAAQVEGWVGNVPLTERLVAVFGGRAGAEVCDDVGGRSWLPEFCISIRTPDRRQPGSAASGLAAAGGPSQRLVWRRDAIRTAIGLLAPSCRGTRPARGSAV